MQHLRRRNSPPSSTERKVLFATCAVYAALLVLWIQLIGEDLWRRQFSILTPILGFLIGSALGSLANVFIFRVPRRLPLMRPIHSICSTCHARLTVLDMLPVLSYLGLRGRCSHCGMAIPPRYLYVELLLGMLWTGIWQVSLGESWHPRAALALCAMSFALTVVGAILVEARSHGHSRQVQPVNATF